VIDDAFSCDLVVLPAKTMIFAQARTQTGPQSLRPNSLHGLQRNLARNKIKQSIIAKCPKQIRTMVVVVAQFFSLIFHPTSGERERMAPPPPFMGRFDIGLTTVNEAECTVRIHE